MYPDESELSEIIPEAEIDWKLRGLPKLFYEWCKECHIHTPIAYDRDWDSKEYIIYTNHPGPMIGKAGCTVDKYNKILQEIYPGWKFSFKEIRGGFANFIDPTKKKRR